MFEQLFLGGHGDRSAPPAGRQSSEDQPTRREGDPNGKFDPAGSKVSNEFQSFGDVVAGLVDAAETARPRGPILGEGTAVGLTATRPLPAAPTSESPPNQIAIAGPSTGSPTENAQTKTSSMEGPATGPKLPPETRIVDVMTGLARPENTRITDPSRMTRHVSEILVGGPGSALPPGSGDSPSAHPQNGSPPQEPTRQTPIVASSIAGAVNASSPAQKAAQFGPATPVAQDPAAAINPTNVTSKLLAQQAIIANGSPLDTGAKSVAPTGTAMTLGSASDTKTKAAMHSSGPQGATDSTRSPIVAVTTGESTVLLSKVEPSQPNRTPSPPNLGSMLPSADVRQPAPSGPTERFAPKAQNTVSFAQPIAGRDASVSKAIHALQSNPGITPQSTLAPPMQVFDLQPRSKTVNTGKDETNSKAPRGENLQSHHPALQQAIHPTVVAPAVAPVPAGVASPDEAGRQLIDGALDKLPARESLTGSIAPASDSGPARLGAATLPSSTQAATPPAQQVAIALRQAPVGTTTEIRLEPEELGRVAMTLRGDEKGMSVHIMADRPETLELLRRQSDSLMSDLADLGYQDVDLQFGTAAEGEDATDHDRGSDDRVTDTGALRDDLDNSQRAAIAPGSGSLDIRL